MAYDTPSLRGRTPHPHHARVHRSPSRVAISRAFTIHDSPRVLDRDTRVPHSTDHDSTRPPTSHATDRAPARWVTRRRPRVVTRARAFRTGHRRRARATFGRSTHARGHCLRRRPTRDRSRGEDVEDDEYDARQPRRAGDDRARARGDDGTRGRRDVRGEGRGEDGCEWMRSRDGANAVDERRASETGDVSVNAIGDLSGTTLPARARDGNGGGRAGWAGGCMDACGVERAWRWSCVVVWCASRVRSGGWDGVDGRDARDARSGD